MWTPPLVVALCFLFVPSPHHKSIGGRSSSRWRAGRATSSRRRSSGRSRRVAAASRRSGRSARRAGPREARFVHVVDLARQSRAMVAAWWNPCIIRPYCAADGGAEEELRGRASLAAVTVSRHNRLAFLLCFCAEPQTSREVDQDPEGGLTRQRNARPSFLIMCCVCESLSQDDDGGLLRSRWTCSRSGRSARRAGPNAAGVLVILSKHTFYTRFHLSLCQRYCEQVRLVYLTVALCTAPLVNLARHTLLFWCRVPVVQ